MFFLICAGFFASLMAVSPAFAYGPGMRDRDDRFERQNYSVDDRGGGRMMWDRDGAPPMVGSRGPGIYGVVTSIDGSTVTIDSPTRGVNDDTNSTTTYTVDVAQAVIDKGGANASIDDIQVGDHLFVIGTLDGLSITATRIQDGVLSFGKWGSRGERMMGVGVEVPRGDGQPVIMGIVDDVNGATLRIKNSGDLSYTVDISGATIRTGRNTSDTENIQKGDAVVVQGEVNGTNMNATLVIDRTSHYKNNNPSTKNSTSSVWRGFSIFSNVKNFFSNLFGLQ